MKLFVAWLLAAQLRSPPVWMEAADCVDTDRLRQSVEFLASDRLRGRFAGEEGCRLAADYLVQRIKKIGLEAVDADKDHLQPFSFRVRGRFLGRKSESANVVGLWRGSDPKLQQEVIVLGAHYDHVGTDSDSNVGRRGRVIRGDDVWNGADDNASGTSALLEIAECLSARELRPKRSLLFVWFSAEEQGLLGSRRYCNDPPAPLADTKAMLNLDMVGRNPESAVDVYGMHSMEDELWLYFLRKAQPSAPNLQWDPLMFSLADSDHDSFLREGIPAIFFFTGEHRDYHMPTDHADRLDYGRLTRVTRFCLAVAVELADFTEAIEYAPKSPRSTPHKSLGVLGEPLSRKATREWSLETGGFVVREVLPTSVAAIAGIQPGDVILELNGRELPASNTQRGLRNLVSNAATKTDIPVLVLREGKRKTLNLRW